MSLHLLLYDFMVNLVSATSYGCKTSPRNHPSTNLPNSSYVVFALIYSVWFSPTMLLCIIAKHLHSGLVCPKHIATEVLWFVQNPFANLRCAAMFVLPERIWQRRRVLLATQTTHSVFF